MRISDLSSDVCSSDLGSAGRLPEVLLQPRQPAAGEQHDEDEQGTEDHQAPRPDAAEVLLDADQQEAREQRAPQGSASADVGDAENLHRAVAAELFGPRRQDAEVVGVKRSEEHTSELQSLMRISYAVFFLKQP